MCNPVSNCDDYASGLILQINAQIYCMDIYVTGNRRMSPLPYRFVLFCEANSAACSHLDAMIAHCIDVNMFVSLHHQMYTSFASFNNSTFNRFECKHHQIVNLLLVFFVICNEDSIWYTYIISPKRFTRTVIRACWLEWRKKDVFNYVKRKVP